MYDVFYISKDNGKMFLDLKKRYPLLKRVDYDQSKGEAFLLAQKKAMSKFFWVIDEEFQTNEDFKLDYKVLRWDEKYVHVFKTNNNNFGGVYIIPKKYTFTDEEIEYNYFVNNKEIDIVAGQYLTYDRFVINTLEDYFEAQKNTRTSMFYAIDKEYRILEGFDYEVPIWDKKYVHVFKTSNGEFGGVHLIPKNYTITKKEAEHNFFVNKKEIDIIAGELIPYDRFVINTPEDYFEAQQKCKTSMFYAIDKDYGINTEFNYRVPKWDEKYVHVFKTTNDAFGGLYLIPKDYSITKKEAEYSFFVNKKEINIVASKINYDQFIINTPEDYFEAQKKCKTSSFYAIDKDYKIIEDLDYVIPAYDKDYVHLFKTTTGENAGAYLIPKNYSITKKEAEYNFFVNKKEVDKTISKLNYDQFVIETPGDYFEAQQKCKTSMFYAIDKDYEVIEDFTYVVPSYDKDYVNVFKNNMNLYKGLCLIPKNYAITKKEAEYSFFINKKELDIIACKINYDRFVIETPEDYFEAQQKCKTSMFYAIDKDYTLEEKFPFIVPDYDKDYVHMFSNQNSGKISLIPKKYKISIKEAQYGFFINKKIINENIGKINYDRFTIYNPEDYYEAQRKSKTSMFYAVDKDYEVIADLNYVIPDYDKDYVTVFKTNTNEHSGVFLIPKNYQITDKETKYNFFVSKKEHDEIVSRLCFDIVFISYNEPNADENWKKIQEKFPRATRVHGIKGIHNAHIEAAKLCKTSMFWVVDGDAVIEEDFDFYLDVPKWDRDAVHVFRSRNPINGLIYGYGGVKLLPTKLVLEMNTDTVDMTTSISKKFLAIDRVSNITNFNTDPFNTWKSAFRECVKLSSKVISGQINDETKQRLEVWQTVGLDKLYGEYAIKGAKFGVEFGTKYADNKDMLAKINDWEWLENEFRR